MQNNNKIIESDLSYEIAGIVFDIQKRLGRFGREIQYADAFENELIKKKIRYVREYPITIEGRNSNFVDFIIEGKIIIDFKAKSFIDKDDYFQMKRYLEFSNLKLGLIINFRQKHLQPKRVLNSKYNLQHSHPFVVSHRVNAFTLIELLITVSIVIVLAAIGFVNLTGYRERQKIELTSQGIAAVLRDAQNRSISQDSGSRWGVHFENPAGASSFYELFRGASYGSGTVLQRANLPSGAAFSEPSSGSSITIIFSPITGFPDNPATVIISAIGNSAVSSTTVINANGEIQY